VKYYGPEPLLQVGLKFKIEYQEISPSGESGKTLRSGNTIHSGEWPVLLPKIDPGRSNSVVFYVYNESRYFARVAPPEVASYINLNDGKRQQASLLHIGMVAGMSFWPVEQTTPPSAIPAPATNPWKHVLQELYASDFTDLMSLQRTLNITISDSGRGLQNTTIDIRFRLYHYIKIFAVIRILRHCLSQCRTTSSLTIKFLMLEGQSSAFVDRRRIGRSAPIPAVRQSR